MNPLDRNLIAALRRDARASVTTLAAQLGVSRATVRNRIASLEARGDIAGYTIRQKSDADEAPVRAVTLLAVEGKAIERVSSALLRLPEVRAVHTTNGRWDLVVDLAADALPAFDAALAQVRQITGVAATETSLLLATLRPQARG